MSQKLNCSSNVIAVAAFSMFFALTACSGSDSSTIAGGGGTSNGGSGAAAGAATGGSQGVGGNISTGGTLALGGNVAVGGTNSAGGIASTGGVANAGGNPTTGGNPSAGGTVSTGGTPTVGGTGGVTTGGSVSTGGSKAGVGGTNTGGAVTTGGSKTTGGATSTGGSRPTGGTANTGGSVATGGTVATGGAAGTGGSTGTNAACPGADATEFALVQAWLNNTTATGALPNYAYSNIKTNFPAGSAFNTLACSIAMSCVEFAPTLEANWLRQCEAVVTSAIVAESSYNPNEVVTDTYATRSVNGTTADDPTVGLLQIRFSSTVHDYNYYGPMAKITAIGCNWPSALTSLSSSDNAWATEGGTTYLSFMEQVPCNIALAAWYYFYNATANGGATNSNVVYIANYCAGQGIAGNMLYGLDSHLDGRRHYALRHSRHVDLVEPGQRQWRPRLPLGH